MLVAGTRAQWLISTNNWKTPRNWAVHSQRGTDDDDEWLQMGGGGGGGAVLDQWPISTSGWISEFRILHWAKNHGIWQRSLVIITRIDKNIPGPGPQKMYCSNVISAAEMAYLSRVTHNWRNWHMHKMKYRTCLLAVQETYRLTIQDIFQRL